MMNAVVKPYHEMCLNSSELIVPRDTYQRALHPARVARIAKEFDERVANEPKISFRDGHYYVMDGQNTIAARKFLNGGEDLQIRCKVYFGMTEREECAFPFALLHRPEFSRRKLWSFSIENICPSHQLRLYGLVHEC